MKKVIALLLCLITLNSFCVVGYATTIEATTEFRLEIDVEKRYTDISEMDDYHKAFLDVVDETEDKKDSRKMVYIAILSVLLVAAIVILVVSLKRVPSEEDGDLIEIETAKSVKRSSKDNKNVKSEKTED